LLQAFALELLATPESEASVKNPSFLLVCFSMSSRIVVCLMLFVGMILVLIFAEALALYGLIVALVLNGKAIDGKSCVLYPSLPL
jgi:hypothetical protein